MATVTYISTVEAAAILGVTRITTYRWVKNGKLSSMRVGRNFLVSKDGVDALVGVNAPQVQEFPVHRPETVRDAVNRAVAEYGETLRKLGSA